MKTPLPRLPSLLFQEAIAQSCDPILITNQKAEIIYVNQAWEKLTGYFFDEVKGKNPSFLQSGKTPNSVYKKMWKKLHEGKHFSSEEVINKKKRKGEYQIKSDIYPVTIKNKYYYIQIQHDITRSKRLDQLRKEFLSTSAHELKTPLTVLKLLTQAHLHKAFKKGLDNIKTDELELIDKELERLTLLINDMLDSSRFDTGQQTMNFQIVDLMEILVRVIEKIRIYAKNHSVTLETKYEKIFVAADPIRIEQVLYNLLTNAVKYSPDGKKIIVAVKEEGKKIIVSVKDEGIGISKSKQKLIFDRYYRIISNSKNGYGLGLYISKEIIKRHKGRIWVESQKGKGSTFFFSLPSLQTK